MYLPTGRNIRPLGQGAGQPANARSSIVPNGPIAVFTERHRALILSVVGAPRVLMRRRLAGPLAFLGLVKDRAFDRVDARAEQAALDAGGAFHRAADELGRAFRHSPGQAVIVIEDLM